MARTEPEGCHRRRFLQTTGGLLAGALGAGLARADEPPEVTAPRAVAADPVEPNWQRRLVVRVGPRKADVVGNDDRAIQGAVDHVARLGGGTVQILPGTYRLRNAIFLQSGVRILGSGDDSVLIKEPAVVCKFAADGNHWDQEITLARPQGFRVGDGVRLVCKDPHHGGLHALQRTLVARSGGRFKLDRALRENFWLRGDPRAATLFPLLSCTGVADVTIETVTLDGDKVNNENLDPGDWDGCISLEDCNRIVIRGVTVRNQNGDGILWATSHDVVVEDCHSHDHLHFGLHAGSGSQRSVVRGNQMRHNRDGFYFCWGAQFALLTNNVIEHSRRYGIHVGHCDTDNVIRDNDIRQSGEAGVVFYRQSYKPFEPHRNRLEQNRIVDSGAEEGIAIDVQGETEAITLSKNELRETREPLSRIGIRIGAHTRDILCHDNEIEGFATRVSDLRSHS